MIVVLIILIESSHQLLVTREMLYQGSKLLYDDVVEDVEGELELASSIGVLAADLSNLVVQAHHDRGAAGEKNSVDVKKLLALTLRPQLVVQLDGSVELLAVGVVAWVYHFPMLGDNLQATEIAFEQVGHGSLCGLHPV